MFSVFIWNVIFAVYRYTECPDFYCHTGCSDAECRYAGQNSSENELTLTNLTGDAFLIGVWLLDEDLEPIL